MTTRAEVESSIVDEETMLDQVARLLERKAARATWPGNREQRSRSRSRKNREGPRLGRS